MVLLLGLSGGLWLWQGTQDTDTLQSESARPATPQPAPTDEVASVQDLIDGEYTFTPLDTSDWKTYRNEELGFEVKYPGSWMLVKRTRNEFDGSVIQLVSPEVQEAFQATRIDYSCDWSISYYSSISDEPENKFGGLAASTLAEMISTNRLITKIGKTLLGGEQATDVVWGGNGAYYTILSDHGSHLYKISACHKESRSDLTTTEMTILASFQFTK